MSIASAITPGCTASNPTVGTANGNGNVNFSQTCTVTVNGGTVADALAGDLGAGCTASGPTTAVRNGQGGVTYTRTCPLATTTKTINLIPGANNCYLNTGLFFDSATTIQGSGYCNETRSVTYNGGQSIPAGVTASGLTITGGNQACGNWNNWPVCNPQSQDYMCQRPPYTAPHGGTWSNVTPSVLGDCGTCRNPEDYLWSGTRTQPGCVASCTPGTQNHGPIDIPCPLGTTGTRQQMCDTLCPTGPTGAPSYSNCRDTVNTCAPVPSNCSVCTPGTTVSTNHSPTLNSDPCQGADFLDVRYDCNATSISGITLIVSEGLPQKVFNTSINANGPVLNQTVVWEPTNASAPRCLLAFSGGYGCTADNLTCSGTWKMDVSYEYAEPLRYYSQDSAENRSECTSAGGNSFAPDGGAGYVCGRTSWIYSGPIEVSTQADFRSGSPQICNSVR